MNQEAQPNRRQERAAHRYHRTGDKGAMARLRWLWGQQDSRWQRRVAAHQDAATERWAR